MVKKSKLGQNKMQKWPEMAKNDLLGNEMV